jgi:hypothetical protein
MESLVIDCRQKVTKIGKTNAGSDQLIEVFFPVHYTDGYRVGNYCECASAGSA